MREYGIPDKIIRMIKALYFGFECTVLHDGKLFSYFLVESGVKQGCLLSGLLFLLVIDWIMKNVTNSRVTEIKWVDRETLENVYYADDLPQVSENVKGAQEKMTRLARKAKGLNFSVKIASCESQGAAVWPTVRGGRRLCLPRKGDAQREPRICWSYSKG